MIRRIAAIVLAAGRSSRCPDNKLLRLLKGKPVVRHTVESVLASRADPVIVVTGHQAAEVCEAMAGLPVTIVENVRFADGLSTSLILGVKSLPAGIDGFVVALGDMPFVAPSAIDVLLDTFAPEAGRGIVVPAYKGQRGNPVVWPVSLISEFLSLTGDKGAKQLMALHGDLVYEVEVNTASVLTDLDRPEDFPAA